MATNVCNGRRTALSSFVIAGWNRPAYGLCNPSKVQESSALCGARFGSGGGLDARDTPRRGGTRNSDRFIHQMKEPDEGWHSRIM
ncbi:hypothetical protein [Sphingopyxis sp.]|uniref:hypothetical protein n=1 Tax=Sphingopyxis sp. TaxID=1908224 RepID=UPI002B49A575|nr:hypothetical protein [Sphingopyxis sp.]